MNTGAPMILPHPPLHRERLTTHQVCHCLNCDKRHYVAECTIHGHTAITLHLLALFMVVFPSAHLSAATGNPLLFGVLVRRQSGRDDGSPYDDKEKYEHSKWHVHR